MEVRVPDQIRKVGHARRLELTWADGHRVEIFLDQGFGFVQTKKRVPFDRVRDPKQLAKEIEGLDVTVAANAVTYLSGMRVSTGQAKPSLQKNSRIRPSTTPPPAE